MVLLHRILSDTFFEAASFGSAGHNIIVYHDISHCNIIILYLVFHRFFDDSAGQILSKEVLNITLYWYRNEYITTCIIFLSPYKLAAQTKPYKYSHPHITSRDNYEYKMSCDYKQTLDKIANNETLIR